MTKLIVLVLVACTALQSFAASPLEVVSQRFDAHNNHDLDRFLATYANDVQIYDYPRAC